MELCDLSEFLPGWTEAELDAMPSRKSDLVLAVGRLKKQLETERQVEVTAQVIARVLRG